MRKVTYKKYVGWFLERISLDNSLFTIELSRYSRGLAVGEISTDRRFRVRLIFTSPKKIRFSKISGGSEIKSISRCGDENGGPLYTLECLPDSFISVTSEDRFTEIQF
jgi:hypothetical protein